MLCNECLKSVTWRFVSKDYKRHLLTINVKVTSDEKKALKWCKRRREIKTKTQSLAGENADRFPPPKDKEVSPVQAGKVQIDSNVYFAMLFPQHYTFIIRLSQTFHYCCFILSQLTTVLTEIC